MGQVSCKFIRTGWREFSRYTRFKVGDGSKISFWHDMCCGEQPLKEAFLKLFSIACLKNVFVVD